MTSLEDLESVAAPLKSATKTLAARAAEAGLDAAAMDILNDARSVSLDALVDVKASFKTCPKKGISRYNQERTKRPQMCLKIDLICFSP